MTETVKCPTCGGKCELRIRINESNRYIAISDPDLAKLRETWKVFENNMDADKHRNAYLCLLETIKELLEEK